MTGRHERQANKILTQHWPLLPFLRIGQKYESKILLAKNEIKQIIDEIRHAKSEKVARRAYAKLSEMEFNANKEFNEDLEEIAPIFKKMDWEKTKIGDSAYLKSLNQIVEIKSLPDKSKNLFCIFDSPFTYFFIDA